MSGMLFAAERRLRCAAMLERDLAATTDDQARKRAHLARANRLDRQNRNPVEALLISN